MIVCTQPCHPFSFPSLENGIGRAQSKKIKNKKRNETQMPPTRTLLPPNPKRKVKKKKTNAANKSTFRFRVVYRTMPCKVCHIMRDLRLKVPALSLQVRQLCPIPPHCVQSCASSSGTSAASAAPAAWVPRRHSALRNRRSLGRPPGFSEDRCKQSTLDGSSVQSTGYRLRCVSLLCLFRGSVGVEGILISITFYFTFFFYFFFVFDRWDFRGNGNLDGRL
jgi:hypothetical protein